MSPPCDRQVARQADNRPKPTTQRPIPPPCNRQVAQRKDNHPYETCQGPHLPAVRLLSRTTGSFPSKPTDREPHPPQRATAKSHSRQISPATAPPSILTFPPCNRPVARQADNPLMKPARRPTSPRCDLRVARRADTPTICPAKRPNSSSCEDSLTQRSSTRPTRQQTESRNAAPAAAHPHVETSTSAIRRHPTVRPSIPPPHQQHQAQLKISDNREQHRSNVEASRYTGMPELQHPKCRNGTA